MERSAQITDSPGDIHPITVPREVFNADTVIMLEWRLPDGSAVDPGIPICDIETSKAVITVEAERTGVLRHFASPNQEIAVGGILGYISSSMEIPLPLQQTPVPASGIRMSAKAKELIHKLGLDEKLFAHMAIVRERDVEEMANKVRDAESADAPVTRSHTEPLGAIQRRVARALEQSRAVPVSYFEVRVDFARLTERARSASSKAKILVTPLDLLVHSVASACSEFPQFNGYLNHSSEMTFYDDINIGVATDVGNDLFVVVVKGANGKSVAELAKELRQLQYLAHRKRLTLNEITGGTVTVTSMIGSGVHRFSPILYPQQAAILGISDVDPGSGSNTVCLGFDHRVANGVLAAAFLKKICDRLIDFS